ncbi:P-loop containing nucleoside triphosphate hydrolase protein [Mycena sanguinolenta]|nr:P-loop containing nucleoside triphosphate hydrolase protein [Mycena sanguinolenta]
MASVWPDSLSLPLYVAVVSIVALSSHLLWESQYGRGLRAQHFKTEPTHQPEYSPEPSSIAGHIEKHGGITIFAYKIARLTGCFGLLSLSLVSLALEEDSGALTQRGSPQISMCMTYFYASVLAIASVGSVKWRNIVTKHLNTVLFCTFGVYFYRDVFPLATFSLVPRDIKEGGLLWTKVIILCAVSCVVPLAIPRQYTPVDPKNPMPVPNPEQTASLWSLVTYFFIDPIIFLGYRVPHLSFDQLPPLSDYDYLENLKKRAWPHMDVMAGKRRHIFFGIIWTHRWSFINMAILLFIMSLSGFISPLGINRLLNYLENPDEESFVKPWFWILLLFLGPMIFSLSFQWYIFISIHILAQTTAMVTQLVFEHALRIRVKSESGDKDKDATASKGSANLLGKMTNLVTTDLAQINEARNVLFIVILVPVQVIGSIIFLYQILGWSAFVGMGAIVVLFPLPGYVSKWQQAAQKATLKKTDARVQTVSETMNVLRMVKMFGWEKQMNEKIAEKRDEELSKLWIRRLLDMASGMLNYFIPLLTMLSTYVSDPLNRISELIAGFSPLPPSTVIAHQDLSASKVFSSMAIFDMLRHQLWFTFHCISTAVNGKVSLDRLDDFLHNTELLDSFTSKDTLGVIAPNEPHSNLIGFRDATFAWSNDAVDGTLTPSNRRFLLNIEGELLFKPGCVNLVLGPTGSGKTSLLMALLGEMHLMPSSLSSWYNLPRSKEVSYAAQESWVMNDTIRNNILFNAPMDRARYDKVLYQCCLERDLELWDAGDETEVGEKGLTLSGGQKARVTLARAIYAHTDIILLDDVLAALDVHTAKWIVDKCLSGDLIKNRTVILVTHNVVMTSKIAGFVVSLGLDGRVHSQGSISDALEQDELLAKEVSQDRELLEAAEKEIDPIPTEKPAKKDGKLVVAEEIQLGHVSWNALNMYFQGMGGAYTVPFFAVMLLAVVATEVLDATQTWYLGYWASRYALGPVAVFKYLGGYSGLLLTSLILFLLSYIYYTAGSFRASRTIHKQLVESVVGTTLRWLDFTPTSRIITRCTVDISAIDREVAESLRSVIESTVSMLVKFAAVVLFTPVFFFAGAIVGIIGAMCGRIYMASQLSVKREQSNARAPVLAHFGATMAGLVSVRAYGAQEAVIQISIDRINRLTRATRTFSNLNRWVTIRIDVLGGLFAASLAYYIVYFQTERPYNIGFSLNMAIGFANMILHWVRILNQFEVQANSLERVQGYLTIEQEPKPTPAVIPPAYWPASGNLSVDNLSAKYSQDGPTVLHDITFTLKSGERVGVVGRTGSGKSSLTLALLRCILTDGTVYYDGVPTDSINLDALRSNITIIPQVPELLVGSLRSNLDNFGQFEDATLNDALRAAGLSSLQEDMEEESKLTLDSEISAGGANLSVGQRQIIALARAIVRGSKLMILDEATSAIDYKTDAVIQSSLRTALPADTTCLIVAHRLQTIMDADKIMVLDAGRIVEFGSPKVLLEKHGLLRALVDESGDREALHRMAGV